MDGLYMFIMENLMKLDDDWGTRMETPRSINNHGQ